MDRSAAVSRIEQTLAFRGTDKSSEIVTALQDAQVLLEKRPVLPWFLQTEVATEETTDGEERVVIPSDFIREWEEDPLWYFVAGTGGDDDAWVELAKEDLGFLRKNYPGEGAPVAYALDVKYFRIFPTPDATYTLKMIYFGTDALLTTDIENDWLKHFPYLMIGEAGKLIATALRDAAAVEVFNGFIAQNQAMLLVENEARMNSSRRFVMGGND